MAMKTRSDLHAAPVKYIATSVTVKQLMEEIWRSPSVDHPLALARWKSNSMYGVYCHNSIPHEQRQYEANPSATRSP